MTQTDALVAAYLARVDRAASRLPAGRREELLGDLREHIEITRAESGARSEAEIRTILERLGDPESIVAAADTQTDLPRVTPAPSDPPVPPHPAAPSYPPYPPAQYAPAKSGKRPLWLLGGVIAIIVMFLLCGAALFSLRSDGPAAPTVVPAQRTSEVPGNGP